MFRGFRSKSQEIMNRTIVFYRGKHTASSGSCECKFKLIAFNMRWISFNLKLLQKPVALNYQQIHLKIQWKRCVIREGQHGSGPRTREDWWAHAPSVPQIYNFLCVCGIRCFNLYEVETCFHFRKGQNDCRINHSVYTPKMWLNNKGE